MKKYSASEDGVAIIPDYPPDDVLALVDLMWIALGCPPSLPS